MSYNSISIASPKNNNYPSYADSFNQLSENTSPAFNFTLNTDNFLPVDDASSILRTVLPGNGLCSFQGKVSPLSTDNLLPLGVLPSNLIPKQDYFLNISCFNYDIEQTYSNTLWVCRSSSSIESITVENPGVFTAIPGVIVTGTGFGAKVDTVTMKAVGGTLNSGSSGYGGYVVNELITLTGGTFSTAAVIKVKAVNAGLITAWEIITPGNYSVLPSNPVLQGSTTGGGTGASFNLTWGILSVSLLAGGIGYGPKVTVQTSTGSGVLSAVLSNPVSGQMILFNAPSDENDIIFLDTQSFLLERY